MTIPTTANHRDRTRKGRPVRDALCHEKPGGDLLSQGVCPQVPSARAGLTAVFGMGTGVTPPPWPPEILVLSKPFENFIASTSIRTGELKPSAD